MYVSNKQGLVLVIGRLDLHDWQLKTMFYVRRILGFAGRESLHYSWPTLDLLSELNIYCSPVHVVFPGPDVYRKTSCTKH